MRLAKKIIVTTASCCVAVSVIFVLSHYSQSKKTSPMFSLLSAGPDAPIVSTGTFSRGDSLESAFSGEIPNPDIFALEKALKNAGAAFLQPGDIYAVALSTAGEARKFVLARGKDVYSAQKETGGIFTCHKGSMTMITSAHEIQGTVNSSLWEAMIERNVPPNVIMGFTDVFAWKIDFLTEPRKGDSFALLWEESRTALGNSCSAKILGAVYRGAETGEEYAFHYGDSYYDEKGASLRRAFLRAPLSYRRISSYFNPKRYHPILRIFRPHNGIDYAAPSGTPVSAVADGRVAFAGRKGGYGKFIELRHGATYITGYGHLRSFAKGIKTGRKVSQGEVIGYVGMTGLATGPHLDFSIKKNGRFVNFLKLDIPPAVRLTGSEFRNLLEEIKPLQTGLAKPKRAENNHD